MKNTSNTVLRLLDANLNRAVEGIRVMEEAARMFLDSSDMTSLLKTLRHDVAECVCSRDSSSSLEILASRASDRDVLRSGETASESKRQSVISLVRANAKRAEEALRSIEEYGKLANSQSSSKAKDIRFRIYDIEKELVLKLLRRDKSGGGNLRLMVTVDGKNLSSDTLTDTVAACIDSGATAIIYKNATADDASFLKEAEITVSKIDGSLPLFIAGRPDIAVAAGADGCHLYQDSLPPAHARTVIGETMLLGVSIGACEHHELPMESLDYIAVSNSGGDGHDRRIDETANNFETMQHIRTLYECLSYQSLLETFESGGQHFMTHSSVVSYKDLAAFSRQLNER